MYYRWHTFILLYAQCTVYTHIKFRLRSSSTSLFHFVWRCLFHCCSHLQCYSMWMFCFLIFIEEELNGTFIVQVYLLNFEKLERENNEMHTTERFKKRPSLEISKQIVCFWFFSYGFYREMEWIRITFASLPMNGKENQLFMKWKEKRTVLVQFGFYYEADMFSRLRSRTIFSVVLWYSRVIEIFVLAWTNIQCFCWAKNQFSSLNTQIMCFALCSQPQSSQYNFDFYCFWFKQNFWSINFRSCLAFGWKQNCFTVLQSNFYVHQLHFSGAPLRYICYGVNWMNKILCFGLRKTHRVYVTCISAPKNQSFSVGYWDSLSDRMEESMVNELEMFNNHSPQSPFCLVYKLLYVIYPVCNSWMTQRISAQTTIKSEQRSTCSQQQ